MGISGKLAMELPERPPVKTRPALPILVLAMAVATASAKPTVDATAKAGALAAQIKTPAVRAALQCRVAFADTTATVPVKDRTDTKGAGIFWATYLKKIRGIDVSACPGDFKAAFKDHLHTVEDVAGSLNNPTPRMSSNSPQVIPRPRNKGGSVVDPGTIGGGIKGHRDEFGDCVATYKAVFTTANQSMKTAPASDGQLANQIDGLLKD